MKKSLMAVSMLSLLMLSSCYKEAQSSVKTGNFKNELLFEHDGCKMYRFMDGTDYIYWSTCDGKVQYTYDTNDVSHNVTAITKTK